MSVSHLFQDGAIVTPPKPVGDTLAVSDMETEPGDGLGRMDYSGGDTSRISSDNADVSILHFSSYSVPCVFFLRFQVLWIKNFFPVICHLCHLQREAVCWPEKFGHCCIWVFNSWVHFFPRSSLPNVSFEEMEFPSSHSCLWVQKFLMLMLSYWTGRPTVDISESMLIFHLWSEWLSLESWGILPLHRGKDFLLLDRCS